MSKVHVPTHSRPTIKACSWHMNFTELNWHATSRPSYSTRSLVTRVSVTTWLAAEKLGQWVLGHIHTRVIFLPPQYSKLSILGYYFLLRSSFPKCFRFLWSTTEQFWCTFSLCRQYWAVSRTNQIIQSIHQRSTPVITLPDQVKVKFIF